MKFSVIRVPFFLEPWYDENKPFIETNRERLIRKWGGPEGWERQKAQHDLKGRGLEAGIPHFNLDRLASNTMASHRLIQHVGKKYGLRVSEGLYDRLKLYYFVEGHSLNDKSLLAKVAAEEIQKLMTNEVNKQQKAPPIRQPAMTEREILNFLNSDEGRVEIETALKTLDRIGVHGIPKFIIEGSTVVDGAAHSDTFVTVFREIERRGEVAHGPIFANILGISEEVVDNGSHSGGRPLNVSP